MTLLSKRKLDELAKRGRALVLWCQGRSLDMRFPIRMWIAPKTWKVRVLRRVG